MILPVILCGGAGVRLWPLSRESLPKQFLPLVDGRSTFDLTLDRVSDRALFAPPLIIANAEHRYRISETLRASGLRSEILLEPMRRDSAMAIGVAATLAASRNPETILFFLAADHVIRDVTAFRASVRAARMAAARNHIVTFGIRPECPATRFGYIRKGEPIEGLSGVFSMRAFAEKPNIEAANRHVAAGDLWNSGNFMMRAGLAVEELRKHAPDIADAAAEAVEGIRPTPGYLRLPEEAYSNVRGRSFDYAVMEATDRAAVIESSFDWRDLGSFEALSELAPRDAAGNTIIGEVVAHETEGSHIHADGDRVVALLGVQNMVVAATDDAILIASRDKVDSIRDLVAEVGASRPDAVAEDRRAISPWGSSRIVARGPRYLVKEICVEPGARLSLQRHSQRSEQWMVVSGIADVTIDDQSWRLPEGESAFIPVGAVHRLANPGNDSLTIIEVQYGTYLGVDDIERFADDYDRLQEPG